MDRGGRARNARTRRKVAAPGLALLFMPGNSGGIVGLGGPCRAGALRAGFRLGLAPLEILSQRRAQAPALPHLLRALFPIVHGRKTTTGRHATEASRRDRPFHGARLRHVRPCGKDRSARAPFLIGRFSHPARRCRSSVVEHPLGKGEVVSSILTGSTTKPFQNRAFVGEHSPLPRVSHANKPCFPYQNWGETGGIRSSAVPSVIGLSPNTRRSHRARSPP